MRENARIAALTGILISLTGCWATPATPLTIAAAEGDLSGLRALLDRGVPPDEMGRDGISPLMWAARRGQVGAMARLLDAGAAIDLRDRHYHGWTPMLHAIHKGQVEAVRLLLDRGADVNAASTDGGLTPLIAASGGCDCDGDRGVKEMDAIVFLLLDRGADPRAEMQGKINALSNAVAAGRTEVVKRLLEAAPDLRMHASLHGEITLLLARLGGRTEILSLLRKSESGS